MNDNVGSEDLLLQIRKIDKKVTSCAFINSVHWSRLGERGKNDE